LDHYKAELRILLTNNFQIIGSTWVPKFHVRWWIYLKNWKEHDAGLELDHGHHTIPNANQKLRLNKLRMYLIKSFDMNEFKRKIKSMEGKLNEILLERKN
jgi:hypothetical protein